MPTTAAAVLVLMLALLPGMLGAYFLEHLSGRDWREKDWRAALRYLAISALGLALYAIAAQRFSWPPARHVIPGSLMALTAEEVPALAVPYLGHIVASVVVGVSAAFLLRLLAKIGGFSARPCAWDTFANDLVQGRWVVVTLKSRDVYAGYLRVADVGVAASERDIVLRDPCRYDESKGEYLGIGYRDIFVQALLVDSIATAMDPKLDQDSKVAFGKRLFQGRQDDHST
jgi:hypothetical protein